MAGGAVPTLCLLLLLVVSTAAPAEGTFRWQWPAQRRSSPASTVHEFLAQQNAARAQVGLPRMAWDENIAAYARRYADERRRDCALVHSDSEAVGLGENIFQGDGDAWTAGDAVKDWVDERRFYDYRANACTGGVDCGHYTQVVWRGTRRVGCARVECDGGGVFVTCNYSPPGNYIGERPY